MDWWLTTYMEQRLFENMSVIQTTKKFTFHEIQRFNTIFIRAHHRIISWFHWVQSTSYVSKIHFNIILSPMPRPPMWFTSFQASSLNSLHISILQGGSYLCWPGHCPVLQGNQCTASWEAHMNFADKSICLLANNVRNKVVTIHRSQAVLKMLSLSIAARSHLQRQTVELFLSKHSALMFLFLVY
jgi:hypothetical protein